MKEFALCIALCLTLLLAACATVQGNGAPMPPSSAQPASRDGTAVSMAEEPQPAQLLCRVIDSTEEGTLLLAEQGAGLTNEQGVYALPLGNMALTFDGKPTDTIDFTAAPGALVEVGYDGVLLESYPAQFSNAATLNVLTEGRDNLCQFYLSVLEDLWEMDAGLNENLTELGVDLSQTSLSPSEQSAVAWAFGQRHELTAMQGTWQELVDQGHISATPLEGDAPEGAAFYEWKDGILYSIAEKEPEGNSSQPVLLFDAQKWRTSLGAYFLCDCTAVQFASAQWDDYTIGSQAIS